MSGGMRRPGGGRDGSSCRGVWRGVLLSLLVPALPLVTGPARGGGADRPASAASSPAVPRSMQECAVCHAAVVEAYLGHGMSRSIGPAGAVPPGVMVHPTRKTRYELSAEADGAWLTATLADGGRRRQRVVGRIGAGIFDTSWVGAEEGPGGAVTGRLFFAPVETVAGRGLELAPFDLHPGSPGMDLALTERCLTCHTTDATRSLPGAAAAGTGLQPYPAHHLGADAFDHLSPLACSACHGDVQDHPEVVMGRKAAPPGSIGLARLGRLPPGPQRDVCARCHLQGDVRIDLVGGRPRPGAPLAGQIPVLVARQAAPDHRFVGQLERLALSACFKATPAMTCTTCHRPHESVAAQGTESFDAACRACHEVAPGHTSLTVQEVTGRPARTPAGCVDCHLRRSQPFDLPHVRSADHFVQRRIRPPRDDLPHREFADREGALALVDDGRLAAPLATPEGRRWLSGVLALGLVHLGRFAEAGRLFDAFPPPGAPEARRAPAAAPEELTPLETDPAFHTVRALVLMASGRFEPARAAFSDALLLQPLDAGARMGRARLALDRGDLSGALHDTQALIEAYPAAEAPWELRVEIAERAGRADLALAALEASARRWPSEARTWLKLGLLRGRRGDEQGAREALARVRSLRPSLLPSAEK